MTRTQDVLEKLGLAYFECESDGRITGVNEPFCQLFGMNCEGILSKRIQEIFHSKSAPILEETLESIQGTGQPVRGLELAYFDQEGQQLLLEISISPSGDQDGIPAGFLGVVRKITANKQVQESLLAVEQELEIGRRIQSSFLPSTIPQVPGWQIETHFEAAREVAGDFYDVFSLSSGRRVGLVMADVVDKGVGAALFMALFRSLIRAFIDQHYKLGWMDVLSSDLSSSHESTSVGQRRKKLSTGSTALQNAIDLTNNFIAVNHGDTNMFATMFVGVLDPTSGSLIYINGGHDPPILRRDSGNIERLEPTGPAVGIMPDMKFTIETTTLDENDTLVAYTDGVQDALNPVLEPFGEKRLINLIEQPAKDAAELRDRIVKRLHSHIAGKSQYDDITLFVLSREPGN